MMLATYFPKFPKCARQTCKQEITALPVHFDGQSWYHLRCWEEGLTELHRAEEIAARFGFAPSALTGVPLLANMQGNPEFWHLTR